MSRSHSLFLIYHIIEDSSLPTRPMTIPRYTVLCPYLYLSIDTGQQRWQRPIASGATMSFAAPRLSLFALVEIIIFLVIVPCKYFSISNLFTLSK